MNVLDPDRLYVYFLEPWFFVDKEERQNLKDERILYADIERQITEEQEVFLKAFEKNV